MPSFELTSGTYVAAHPVSRESVKRLRRELSGPVQRFRDFSSLYYSVVINREEAQQPPFRLHERPRAAVP